MADFIRFEAKTVEDAVNIAASTLGCKSDELDYNVIDKGSNGFLGFIGNKPAVIEAKKKETSNTAVEEKCAVTEEVQPAKTVKSEEAKEEKKDDSAEGEEESVSYDPEELSKRAVDFLTKVFAAMNMEATIETSYKEEEKAIEVNVSGENMGNLIGKRGQTLDSLQYLTSLAVNKGIRDYVRVKLDTENYRERRQETLENLAKNIAFKVKRTKRPVKLEPMNPYERRIIHSALQDDRYVYTKSEGEEPFRHVVVLLKKEKRYNDRRR